jgi:outer membrane protein TolC
MWGVGGQAIAAGSSGALTGLPQESVLRERLLASPSVRSAMALLQAEQATAQVEKKSPVAWSLSGGVGYRTFSDDPNHAPGETELTLQRPWRSGNKEQAQQQWFEQRERWAQAQIRMTARTTLRDWLDGLSVWLREEGAARLWVEQLTLSRKQAQAVGRRHELGDVSRAERDLAEAAQVQVEAQATQAQARAKAARARLSVLLPAWSDVDLAALLSSEPPAIPADAAGDGAPLEDSPELQLVQAEAVSATAAAQFEVTQRRADPTVGVRVGTAKGPDEKFVGLVFSMPLDGSARESGAQAAAYRAANVAARVEVERQRIAADRAARAIEAANSVIVWRQLTDAATRFDAHARTTERAWQLGQAALTDVVVAQRLALEQRLAAQQARADALFRHWLWVLDQQPTLAAPI